MKEKSSSVFKGSIFLGVGAFLAKLIGVLYRIPLTAYIGAYGIGLYQMVFPVYTLLLDFSGAGVPNALSKIIASCKEESLSHKYLRLSVRLFSILGIISGAIMIIFSKFISKTQGDINASLSYVTLAPAVLFVCLISSLRGYFQGKMNMLPTALSQIVEQIVKLVLGLTFCIAFLPNVPKCVSFATFAITISEMVAFLLLLIIFKKQNRGVKLFFVRDKGEKYFSGAKTLLKIVIPVTILGVILPFSQVIDSFITINLLKRYLSSATTLYGLFSGVVMTIIHLPVSISYGISVTIIPAISKSDSLNERESHVKKSMLISLVFGLIATTVCIIFAEQILLILFRNLNEYEFNLCVGLLKITSISILFHVLLQTTNGVLIGGGNPYLAVIGMLFGVVTKVVVSLLTISNPKINIYGSAISSIACYFIAFLVNLIILIKKVYVNADKKTFAKRQVNFQ